MDDPPTKLTTKRKKRFLDELAQAQSVTYAARRSGVSRYTLYEHRKNDPLFKQAWEDALEQGADALEDEAVRRGMASSDTLLIFLLKSARPQKFRETVAHTGHAGGPIVIQVLYEDEKPTGVSSEDAIK